MLRTLRWLAVLFALLIIGAVWQAAHAQATDSTVYIALRTRTGSTGKIISTSATKLDKLPSSRVDTVRVPVQAFVYWQPNVAGCRVAWEYALGTSSPPPAVTLTSCGTARVDTVKIIVVVHDTVPVTPAPTPNAHAPELPRGTTAMDAMLAESARAAAVTSFRDTLYTATAADGLPEQRCKGLDCNTPAMVQWLKDYTAELRRRIASGEFVPPPAKP